jgi:CDP-paratose synthetase
MKILITGPNGFIAKHLIQQLGADPIYEVITLGREVDSKDIPDFFLAHQPDVVVHLATLFLKDHTYPQIDGLIASNLTFLTHLLEASQIFEIKKFIAFGTYYQFPNPASLYAATKSAAEPILDYYAIQKSLPVQCLYLYDTYGPADTRDKILNRFIRAAQNEEELLLSPGHQKLKLIHVLDVVDAILSSLQQPASKSMKVERATIEPLEAPSLRELAHSVEQAVGRPLKAKWGHHPYIAGVQMDPSIPYPPLEGWKAKRILSQGLAEMTKLC